ncbi:CD225/dispanin family protein [Stenotrophomonas maltophilia]|uniref:CD225/dispanin family protein n=1 Tax=Stenotrophomonas maltophilia TaxID=40324 RepID=UPI0034DAD5F0
MSTPQPPQTHSGAIPTYMTPSIILTVASFIVCCLSCVSILGIGTGIVAIVFANKTSKALTLGDIAAAQAASRTAKIWMWITAGLLILGLLVWIISLATMGVDGYMMQLQQFQQQLENSR